MKSIWGMIFSSILVLGQDAPPPVSWAATAALAQARHSGCAVRLRDGRILVTGGVGVDGDLASAELYQPDGAFLRAADMNVARSRHSCTLLSDGRVLLAGGDAEGSAEVYDPAADTWLLVAGARQSRAAHTATLLPDNRVLLAGGESPDGPLDSLNLFDPATNTITRSASALATARTRHVAVPLPDGRVLFIAGRGLDSALASTELYNSSDDTISEGPSLHAARTGHSATLLDDGRILVAGGSDGETDLDSAELYDPETAVFQTLEARLQTARRDHLALLVPGNGGVLLAGGLAKDNAIGDTEIYLPLDNLFLRLGNLTLPRSGLAGAALSDGVILATGGLNADGPQVACGLLLLPAISYSKGIYHPGETVEASGSNFQPGTKLNLALSLATGIVTTASQSRLITPSVTLATPPAGLVIRVGFSPVPILLTLPTDAGKSARLTAQASGGISLVASVPIKVATSITLSLPATLYEGFNATFLAQISRPSNPAPLTGAFSLEVVKPSTATITDGSSNTIIIGEQPVTTVSLNTAGTSFILSKPFNNLPPGQLNVKATYAGDAANEATTATATYVVAGKTPMIQLTTSATSPEVGVPFKLSAAVSAQAANPPRGLTGAIGFLLSGFLLDTPQPVTSTTSSPSANVARLFTPSTLDPITVSANYTGDSFFKDVSSVATVVTPQKATTTLTLLNPPSVFACNQPITVTARLQFPPTLGLTNRTINGFTTTSNGSVPQLLVFTGTLVPDPQVPGQATGSLTLAPTDRSNGASVTFSGDTLLKGSVSGVSPLTLTPSAATVRFINLPAGPVTGSTTLTVQVTSDSCDIPPTGNIEFLENGSVIAVKPLLASISLDKTANATSTLLVSRPVGGRTFQARYSGNSAYLPSTSQSVSVVFQ